VLGGGSSVWEDVKALEEAMGRPWDGYVIAANDIGCHWPGRLDHWCTLHPEKFADWMKVRRENGLPDGYTTWTLQNKLKKPKKGQPPAPHRVAPPPPNGGGASGLVAVFVALDALGCDQVVLCGMPMDKTPHFAESKVHQKSRAWAGADSHWRVWTTGTVQDKLRGRVTSMSGRTRDLLGAPTPEWLTKSEAA
jgi:hypothetical protein